METNRFRETDANDFDSELISSRIAASKQETILKLRQKLANLLKASETGKASSAAQIADLQNKISALETSSACQSVDLPTGLPAYPQVSTQTLSRLPFLCSQTTPSNPPSGCVSSTTRN